MKEELIFETNEHLKADSKEETEQISRIMMGIDYIFDKKPELYAVGTKEQYFKYLKTIFPSSLVKEIVYHGTDTFKKDNEKISGFDNLSEGTFFTDNLAYAKSYAIYRSGNIIIPAVLNIQNPANYKHLKGAFGLLNEDSSLYEGYSRIKGMGFDGYISKPNFDTPDYKV